MGKRTRVNMLDYTRISRVVRLAKGAIRLPMDRSVKNLNIWERLLVLFLSLIGIIAIIKTLSFVSKLLDKESDVYVSEPFVGTVCGLLILFFVSTIMRGVEIQLLREEIQSMNSGKSE